ncbi:NERD domain-containing protein [Shewanella benthica]|nr:NERD domain-containing protein [Shewanella benthica]
MAKMFPKKLPLEVLSEPKRSSEVQVYNALREQLDDDYHVFYSSPWLGTNSDGSEIDGEADFLVAHSEKGILSIEVKGGIVEIDSDDNWTSTDRYKIKRHIKNPVNQARSSKHQLLKKLKESSLWSTRYICVRHGVILPHSARPSRDLRPDMPLNLFAFDTDMVRLKNWVDERFQSLDNGGRVEKPLGIDGLYALEDMLARVIKLRVRLGTNVNQDLKEIALKTNDQIFILREMEANNRMAIAGAAGTGKTILAIEKAVQLNDQGKRVLLLCFNRPLGGELRRTFKDYPSVTATHYHQFCRDVASGVKRFGSSSELVDNFIDNFTEAGLEEFDAVIIDEGQDFKDDWLMALEVVIKDSSNGVLYIFYDDNQNVMTSNASYIKALPLAKHTLTRNFRNTESIFKMAKQYYRGDFVRPIGPRGTKPILHSINNEAELKVKLAERVGSLTKAEGLNYGDIAILFPCEKSMKCMSDGAKLRVGRHSASDAENRSSDHVVIDTIRRFKGLESSVVLMVVNSETSNRDELLYTGITRGQAILEIFGPSHVLHQLEKNNV